jgi:glyoxylase-like metal-dependent hydrolase (beta-lactamase superfamily II)
VSGILSALVLLASVGGSTQPTFDAQALAPGVWVLRPAPADASATNSLVVEREDGLLVVDAQPTPEAARRLLEVVARTSAKPVRYLVLSHAHAESAGGASAFPETTLVVGRSETLSALKDPEYDFGAEVRERASDPGAWVAPKIRLPVLVIEAKVDLQDERNQVEIFPVPQSHSTSDIIVSLPDAGILWAGAISFPDRNPYGRDASIGGWVATLNQLAKMAPKVVVPSRGEPLDGRGVRVQRDSLAWLRGQIEQAFVDRVPAAEIADRVLRADDLSQYFDTAAAPSFLRVLTEVAVEEAVVERRKRGLM